MEEEDGNPNSHSQGGSARRNMKKNKKHSLPLKMFLSVDGDDMVRPECPNASNPFHKCADYCTLRAPEPKNHEGSKGVKKVEARRHVDPNCRYASNPYHSCGPYCYEDDGESSSSYSSSSLHQFKEDKREEVKSRDVDPKCKNASNPYHKCSDYCFGGSSGSEERKESSRAIAKGKEGVEMKRNVVANCINASNPFHVCGSYCLPIIPKKSQNKGDVKKEAQSSNCKYASNPYHNCTEFCSTGEKGFVPKKMEKRNVHSHPENETVKTDEAELSTGAVKVSEKQISRNSSTSCSESSKEHLQSFYEQELLERFGILRGNEDDLVATEKRELHLKHIDSFDLNHHFIAHCRQSYHEEEYYPFEKVLFKEKSKGDVKMQHHQWIDAHDSDSKISAHCLQRFSESDQSEDGKTVIPPSSSIRFVLLFVSVLYYIAHVIITGGVVMDKNTSRIKEREDERASCNIYCIDEKNREM